MQLSWRVAIPPSLSAELIASKAVLAIDPPASPCNQGGGIWLHIHGMGMKILMPIDISFASVLPQ